MRYLIFLESNKFICRRQGCKLNNHEEGKDYVIYIKNNSDCIPCQKKCEEDKKCGAVWCESKKNYGWEKDAGHCVWWRTGKCLDDYDVFPSPDHYDKRSGYTCYKGKIENVALNKSNLFLKSLLNVK